MKLWIASLAAAAVPAIALATSADEVVFGRVAEGVTLKKSWEVAIATDLKKITVTVIENGEEQPEQEPELQMKQVRTKRATFVDEYLAVSDGRPTKLRRTFETLGALVVTEVAGPAGKNPSREVGEGELEGETIVFEWQGDENGYKARFDEGSNGDESLLPEMVADTELRSLLPDKPVSPGESWTIRPDDLLSDLFYFGGDLELVVESDPEEEPGQHPFQQLARNAEGKVTGTLVEVVEENGERLAVIRVEADVHGEMEDEGSSERETGRSYRLTCQLEGELQWLLGSGHPLGFEIGGDASLSVTRVETQAASIGDVEVRSTMVLEGKLGSKFFFEE